MNRVVFFTAAKVAKNPESIWLKPLIGAFLNKKRKKNGVLCLKIEILPLILRSFFVI